MEEFNIKIDASDPVCNSALPSGATTLYMSIPNKNYDIALAPAPIPFTEEYLRRMIAEEIEKAIPRIAEAVSKALQAQVRMQSRNSITGW